MTCSVRRLFGRPVGGFSTEALLTGVLDLSQTLKLKQESQREANVIGRTAGLLFISISIASAAPAWAHQAAATATQATIQCESQPYVPVTADEEQAMPFHLVDKAACGSQVTVLSDPQGYTVKVRTTRGKIGYVARYQIAIVFAAKVAATASGAADASGSGASNTQSAMAENSPAQQKGPRKPRVYVSDTASWNASGGFSRASSVAPGALYGGYNPELTDIYQDFTSDCSAITVTQKKPDADFVVLFDKGTPKKGFTGLHGLVKVNKVTVLSKSGETLLSNTARSEDVAVSMACNAVSQPANSAAANTAHESPH
jgi:hypothetical protein